MVTARRQHMFSFDPRKRRATRPASSLVLSEPAPATVPGSCDMLKVYPEFMPRYGPLNAKRLRVWYPPLPPAGNFNWCGSKSLR